MSNKNYLGLTGSDRITGFTGVVTGHLSYISGCEQLLLVPPVDKEGKMAAPEWFDIQRVEFTADPRVILRNEATPGPDSLPPRRNG